jgi:hypothetical protein
VTKPTLLQQARQSFDYARALPDAQANARFAHVGVAVNRILQHLEQQHADSSGPARTPGEPRCKVCGDVADSAPHRFGSDDHVKHDFVPNDSTADDRVAALEAMSEAHDHNIATLFRDLEGLQKPARTPSTAAVPALDLDALQRLCDAATCGPWEADDGSMTVRSDDVVVCDVDTGLREGDLADAAFISAARDALPKLIARVRELQAEADKLCDLCDQAGGNWERWKKRAETAEAEVRRLNDEDAALSEACLHGIHIGGDHAR